MSQRHSTLLWIKDLLDHMSECHDRLLWASEGPAESFLTEALLVDLTECRRLCEALKGSCNRESMALGAH
ncbi:MAG: hypothetical protein SFX72_02030 [Isosphaeraceae bacterium]|nr:hypothetical protein [Isosphaeraceae bacterium]